jgi:hypothetical protein
MFPTFSVVAPCRPGASSPSVLRRDVHRGLRGSATENNTLENWALDRV